jgi:hypothetical protein
MLKELVRVANDRTIVKRPHKYGKDIRRGPSMSMFSRTWFGKPLTKIKEITGLYLKRLCPKYGQFGLLFFLEETIVKIVKVGE